MTGRRAAAFLTVLVLSWGGMAAAQEELAVSLEGGLFSPKDELARRIYGAGFAAAVSVGLKLRGPFGVASGFEIFSDEGAAASFDPEDAAVYPVRFRRWTVPVLLFYQLDLGRVDIRAGAGAGVHRFRETWQTVDLDYKAGRAGPRLTLMARVALVERLSLVCSAVYDSFKAGAASPNARDVDLGGFQVRGGLSYRIH